MILLLFADVESEVAMFFSSFLTDKGMCNPSFTFHRCIVRDF